MSFQAEAVAVLDPGTLDHNLKSILGEDNGQVVVPYNYLVIDLETTHTEPALGEIWQFGYHINQGGSSCGTGHSVLVQTPEEVLRSDRFEIERRAAVMSKHLDQPAEELEDAAEEQFVKEVLEGGIPRDEAMRQFTDLITACVDAGYALVGQNFVKFDIPYIEHYCHREKLPFKFPSTRLVDTGMLIKAARLKKRMIALRETPRAFYHRVAETRAKGCYFSLEKFCIPYWHLDTKYAVNTDSAHDAGYDCFITEMVFHELIEEAKR